MFLPIIQGNIPLRGNRHNKQSLPGDQNVPQRKPEVWEDQSKGGGQLGVFIWLREGHHQVEKVADDKKQETLVEGCGSEISPQIIYTLYFYSDKIKILRDFSLKAISEIFLNPDRTLRHDQI